jgi:hypothetical protein
VIDAYLERALRPLARRLPPGARQELRLEMRMHLQALIDAYCELGSTPDEALVEALRRFGDAGIIGREWQRAESGSPLLSGWPAVLSGTLLALSALGVSAMLTFPPALSAYALVESLLTGPAIPLVAGFLAGRADRGQSRRTLLRLALISLGGLVATLAMPGIPPQYAWDVGPFRLVGWGIVACGACGLGMLSAARRSPGKSKAAPG